MTKDRVSDKPDKAPSPREERLRAALRANLSRRKAQSRARQAQTTGKPEQEDTDG